MRSDIISILQMGKLNLWESNKLVQGHKTKQLQNQALNQGLFASFPQGLKMKNKDYYI